MSKKYIIFDLDGTLIDTLHDLTEAVNFGLSKYGYPKQTLKYVEAAIGDGVETLIKRCIPNGIDNKDYLNVLESFREYYQTHYAVFTRAYENTYDTLLSLKGSGYKLAVVTNKIDSLAIKLIDKFFYGIFDVVVGARATRRKKPHRETMDIALKELGVEDIKECIYIGDTDVDYKFAVNTNMDLIFVSYGYRSKEYLKNIDESVLIIDDFIELRKIFIK